MKKARHERPLIEKDENGVSIKNPNKIAVGQHVIPCKHLLEWSSDGKMVRVHCLDTDEVKSLPASSHYFCVMRLWDQWTETEMLKRNEDNYQIQIELMRRGLPFTHIEHIMAYYVLLCVRIWVANKERPHYPSSFSSISYECDKSELEDNELEMEGSVHVIKSTIEADSQHAARQVVKMAMNQVFIQWCEALKSQSWKPYQSDGEKFILSDALYNNFSKEIHVLPVSPEMILIAESTYLFLEKSGSLSASCINEIMKRNAVDYCLVSQ